MKNNPQNAIIEETIKGWVSFNSYDENSPTPIDVDPLFDLFERYNDTTYYMGGGGGTAGGTTKCCATGTCDNISYARRGGGGGK